MSQDRPAVPLALERRLKEEAGYRCAISRCGGTVRLEMAHIEPWAKVQEHKFENMICLCGDCHWRYDKLGQIPKLSILQFKRNLSLLSHRYTQVENQVLSRFAKDMVKVANEDLSFGYGIHPGMVLLYQNLLDDGLAVVQDAYTAGIASDLEATVFLLLTDSGRDFVARMIEAEDLEEAVR